MNLLVSSDKILDLLFDLRIRLLAIRSNIRDNIGALGILVFLAIYVFRLMILALERGVKGVASRVSPRPYIVLLLFGDI